MFRCCVFVGSILAFLPVAVMAQEPKNCENEPTLEKELECLSRPIERPQLRAPQIQGASPSAADQGMEIEKERALRAFDAQQKLQVEQELLELIR
jgi:hypothetical protein